MPCQDQQQHALLLAAITHNNEGSTRLQNKNFREAFGSFAAALRTIHSVVATTDGDGDMIKYGGDASTLSSHPQMLGIDRHMVGMGTPSYSSSTGRYSSQQTPYCYTRPVHIPITVLHQDGLAESSFLTCVVIFNLALTHQLSAQGREEGREDLFDKAAKLYEYAFSLILSTRGNDPSPPGEARNDFFLLTLINNLAVIYQTLEDLERSSKYFELLLSSLICLVSTSGDKYRQRSLDINEGLQGFLWNATRVFAKTIAAPAA